MGKFYPLLLAAYREVKNEKSSTSVYSLAVKLVVTFINLLDSFFCSFKLVHDDVSVI